MSKPAHYCPEWDFELIQSDDPEMESCICDFDNWIMVRCECCEKEWAQPIPDEFELAECRMCSHALWFKQLGN